MATKHHHRTRPHVANVRSFGTIVPVLGILALLVPVVFVPYCFDPFLLPKQLLLLTLAALLLVLLFRHGVSCPVSRLACWGLGIGAAVEATEFAAAPGRYGAILGNFGYRLGLSTHVALAIVFFAAFPGIRTDHDARHLLRYGVASMGIIAAYGLLQFGGADPFRWTAHSNAIFSTIGNSNDLAGYAVPSLGYLGAFTPLLSRRRVAWLAVALFAVTLTVALSESRSGALGLALALALLPAVAPASGWQQREMRRPCLTLVGAVPAGCWKRDLAACRCREKTAGFTAG